MCMAKTTHRAAAIAKERTTSAKKKYRTNSCHCSHPNIVRTLSQKSRNFIFYRHKLQKKNAAEYNSQLAYNIIYETQRNIVARDLIR